jgi:hypothetical protein
MATIDSPASVPTGIPGDPGGTAKAEMPNLPSKTPSLINPCSRYDLGTPHPQPFDGPADVAFTVNTNPTVNGPEGVKIDGFMPSHPVKPTI